MNWRLKKQLIYGGIFLIIFLSIVSLIYFQFRKPLIASCFDNKKNQNEEGVDCGGPCPPCELKNAQPLKKYPIKFLIYPDKTIDIIGVIENPNTNLALKKLRYQFLIYDFEGNLKATTTIGETVLLPLEKRYLLKINHPPLDFTLGKIDLKISEPEKEDFVKVNLEKLPISIYNEKLIQENNRWQVSLTLFNQSLFPYNKIEVIVFVYNENNNLIAVAQSHLSLKGEETKNIILTLPEINIKPVALEVFLQRTNLER